MNSNLARLAAGHMARTAASSLAAVLLLAATWASLQAPPARAAAMQPGALSPAVDVPLLDGRVLSAEAQRGKVVLRMFWATWCHVCIGELPAIDALYRKYRERGFEVMALSLDRDPGVVRDFWQMHDYRLPLAMRTPALRGAFGDVAATPTFHLTDRGGVLRELRIGAFADGELDHLVAALVSVPPPAAR